MPLITNRNQVLEIYAVAAEKKWVIPCFCSENLTTTEAVLAAVAEHGKEIGDAALPVTLAITNLYSHRSQTLEYTCTRNWRTGLKLFLNDLKILCDADSPFRKLNVMVHLDHIQHDVDAELLDWSMEQFSSIMYDASALPLAENISKTAEFVEKHRAEILIEGACDEIIDAGGNEVCSLTSPEKAMNYFEQTGVDMMVVNLGTEHRAGSANLQYHGEIAREICFAIAGSRLVLHGCSSVTLEQLTRLFDDGICKVNIWTTLERDSAPVLLSEMARNAAKIAGPILAEKLFAEGILGSRADRTSNPSLEFFPTVYRQNIVFGEMRKIVRSYLRQFLLR